MEALSEKPTLLVLDNFEHLVEGGSEWCRHSSPAFRL